MCLASCTHQLESILYKSFLCSYLVVPYKLGLANQFQALLEVYPAWGCKKFVSVSNFESGPVVVILLMMEDD
jgi:hypothetical protein